MKFDRSNKFDLCYYGQVNSLRLKSSVALFGNIFGNIYLVTFGNIYFAGDGILRALIVLVWIRALGLLNLTYL